MSDAKQVATKKENLPSASLFEADAQAGFENVKTESLAPPILKLLQNGSAETKKRNPKLRRKCRTWNVLKHCYETVIQW